MVIYQILTFCQLFLHLKQMMWPSGTNIIFQAQFSDRWHYPRQVQPSGCVSTSHKETIGAVGCMLSPWVCCVSQVGCWDFFLLHSSAWHTHTHTGCQSPCRSIRPLPWCCLTLLTGGLWRHLSSPSSHLQAPPHVKCCSLHCTKNNMQGPCH